MKFRKLRIAWSVVWGVLAALLIVLWVRSYWRAYSLEHPYKRAGSVTFQSVDAVVRFAVSESDPGHLSGWKLFSDPVEQWAKNTGGPPDRFAWSYVRAKGFLYVACPHWVPATALFAIGAAPWIRWRFNLRTLLIATTLIAVLLGLVVWATR